MTFKALLLDERDVFVALVELDDETQITNRHVDLRPFGGDCDNPVGEYRWNRDLKTLEPLPRQQRSRAGRPTFEQAVAFDYLNRWDLARADPSALTAVSLAWLDDMVCSIDFTPFLNLPVVVEYIVARGLQINKKD